MNPQLPPSCRGCGMKNLYCTLSIVDHSPRTFWGLAFSWNIQDNQSCFHCDRLIQEYPRPSRAVPCRCFDCDGGSIQNSAGVQPRSVVFRMRASDSRIFPGRACDGGSVPCRSAPVVCNIEELPSDLKLCPARPGRAVGSIATVVRFRIVLSHPAESQSNGHHHHRSNSESHESHPWLQDSSGHIHGVLAAPTVGFGYGTVYRTAICRCMFRLSGRRDPPRPGHDICFIRGQSECGEVVKS